MMEEMDVPNGRTQGPCWENHRGRG
jgi:hypothetical protein